MVTHIDPRRETGDIPPTLSDAQHARQSWRCGAVQPIPPGSVDEAFERQARERPDAAALVYAGTSYGYAELNARANRLAHGLR
ncbi:AMP-binding protein, partial [Dyella jejuensis]